MSLGLATEVVANSNSQILVLSANAFSNLSPNGATYRVSGGGFLGLGVFGSATYIPAANINIYVGANGTSADPLVSSFSVPTNQNLSDNGPLGSFSFDSMITLRANGKAAVAPNGVYTGLVLNPFAVQTSQSTNGNVNVSFTSGTANLANISVYAVAGSTGQNANLVFESCVITALTSV